MVKVTQKILQCMSSLKPSIVLTTDWLQSNQGVSFLVVSFPYFREDATTRKNTRHLYALGRICETKRQCKWYDIWFHASYQ